MNMVRGMPDLQRLRLLRGELISMPPAGISKTRLAQVALEIISLKKFYEDALEHASTDQRKDLTDTLHRIDELERLVARLNLLRRIKIHPPLTDLGSPPKVNISP